MALAQFAPMIAGWLGGSKAENVAQKVVGVAQAVTGTSTPDAALAAIQANPDLAMQFQTKVVESQVEMAQIAADITKAELAADTADTAAVNQTMQVEAKADHWPTYSWRPAIGFAFALNMVTAGLNITVAYLAVMFFGVKPDILSLIPQMLTAQAALNGTALPILGVASYFRGKMQADPRIPTDNRG
ncbi:hypothetical protein [Paraburkholderia sp.]|nr:hypothetical protein [Paraburkholderia sp.]